VASHWGHIINCQSCYTTWTLFKLDSFFLRVMCKPPIGWFIFKNNDHDDDFVTCKYLQVGYNIHDQTCWQHGEYQGIVFGAWWLQL
jgi:hypothetical protein